jgi:hypothetical protein
LEAVNVKKPTLLLGLFCTVLLLALLSTPAAAQAVSTPFLQGASTSRPMIVTAPDWQPAPLLIPPGPSGEYVAIVVENSLWGTPAVQTAVTQYRTDLNNTGYNTILYTSAIASAPTLRGLLQGWYSSNSIIGAVLIGNLPYIRYYHPANPSFSAETFVCDLYYMDLDGNWYDTNSDTIYDTHNSTAGTDIFPEIYVGRIDATTRNLGGQTNTNDIITLLNRTHSYRIGGVARTHRAITYIDDDWQSWADGTYDNWPAWLNNVYSTRTDVHTPASWTNGTDWLTNRLTQDYEWAHLCAHSGASPGMHYFGPKFGPSEGTVSSTQIHNQVPTFNFYNLFCCHGADWLTTDCLATTYLYSGSHSIGVVGSTKTGGMLGGTSFYNALGQNDTLGKALETWFQGIKSYDTYFLEWFYGMTILGDPFLTTHYDITALPPSIYSLSHPNQSLWYANALPTFQWIAPPEVNSISGYYYILDQIPSTIPTASTGNYTTNTIFTPASALTDGHWYLHVVSKDSVGNVGTEAAHFQVNIDNSGPVTTITSHVNNYNSSTSSLNLVWTATDAGVGYHGSALWLDGTTNLYSGPNLNYGVTGLTEGSHLLNVTCLDLFMFATSDWITIHVDLTNPTATITSHSNGDQVPAVFTLTWTATDGQTGYHYTEVYVNGILDSTVQAPLTSTFVGNLTAGTNTITVVVFDWSGRSTTDSVSVTTLGTTPTTPPGIPGFPIEAIVIGAVGAIGLIALIRRRKH